MGYEHHSLRFLSPDATCNVGRRIHFAASPPPLQQSEQQPAGQQQDALEYNDDQDDDENTLQHSSITWDNAALERCFGWPAELVESSFAWWSERLHPDDRLRTVASLKRALFKTTTTRYWTESYRFRVYDGSPDAASSSSSSSSTAPPAGAAADAASRGEPTATEAAELYSYTPSLASSRSPTPRQYSSFASTIPPASEQVFPSAESIDSKKPRADSTDDSQFVTVLDQLYIARAPSSKLAASLPSTSNSSRPHDRHRNGPTAENDQQQLGQSAPTTATGTMFAIEQRVKTSEALHTPRSKLMRSISNLSASSNASSSNASNGAPASSSGSYVSVPSSAGAMQRSSQQQHPNPNHPLLPLSPRQPQINRNDSQTSAAGWNQIYSPTSPVSSPSTSSRAFSFLDVEGVRTILENTQSGLTMVDANGRPTYFNAAGAAITGYSNLDELRAAGKDLHESLHHSRPDGTPFPASECPIVRAMATLTRVTNQADTFFRKDGNPFPVIWSVSPISKLGRSIGAVLEFRDVTEEKLLEQEKIKATLMNKHQEITIREANASKQRMTQFLDYIAHELRNPLHGIAANIEFLRDSLTALQSAYNANITAPPRPAASPLQSSETATTPSGASVSLLSINSQSSSIRSSSATSSISSRHSILNPGAASHNSSPRLDLPNTQTSVPSTIPSASIPTTEIPSPLVSPPMKPTHWSAQAVNDQTGTADHSEAPTPKGLVPVDRPREAKLPDSMLPRQEDAENAADIPVLPKKQSIKALDKSPTKRIVDTITSIDDAAQKQLKAHFEHSSSRGPPPWQAEDKKSLEGAGGAMANSPLLADIAKHTATASTLAEQQNDLAGRRSGSQTVPASTQTSVVQRKTLPPHPSASKEDLKASSPASPSLSTATILESEADTETPYLSNTEIQQVLQTSQSFITSIRECVFHATHITNNVLDLSRFEAGKVELLNDIVYPARVASLAVDMMMARAQEKEIELRLDIPEDQTLVRGDGTRLAQVFLNLLSNAIKFTPRGGQVTLRFRVTQEAGRTLLTGSIIDTGMGMSKAEMSNLFQRFGQSSRAIQAEYGGTGLGLSICQEIVTLQGGKMSVESEKGTGSTFSFTAYYQSASEDDVKEYLRKTPGQSRRGSVSPVASPISEPGEATASAAINAFIPALTSSMTGQTSPSALPEDQQARLRSLKTQLEAEQAEREPFRFKHILVAEDNGINQNIMKNYLKKLGYQYTIVNNGQEVLDTFVNKTHETPIDVILMDCEMPVMDGRQATEHIRQHEHFRKNLVTPLDSPFNLQLGAAEINNLQATPPTGVANVSYSPPLASPTSSSGSSGRRLHRTPIIGLSGNARQELVNQALASGMDDYVVKPFKLVELEKVLKKWEQTIDDQLVQRNIAVKAKEFMDSTMTSASPVKARKVSGQSDEAYRAAYWARTRSGSGSSKSDTAVTDGSGSSSHGPTGSPKPIRPPLLSSLSASRLPREQLLAYGSPERPSSRPKLPSRLSNEWVRQTSASYEISKEQVYNPPAARPRMPTIASDNSSPATTSPLLDSPAPSPPAIDGTAATLAPSLLQEEERHFYFEGAGASLKDTPSSSRRTH